MQACPHPDSEPDHQPSLMLVSHRSLPHTGEGVPAPRRGPPLSVVSNISPPVDWSQDRPTLQQEKHMSCNPCWSDFSSPSIAITNLPKQPRLTCPKWLSSAAVKQETGMPKAARRILNFWPLLAPTLLCVFCPDCCSVLLSSAVQCCPDPHHVSLVLLFPPPSLLLKPCSTLHAALFSQNLHLADHSGNQEIEKGSV